VRSCSRSEEHVGEWKLSLWADTLEELFAEAARVVSRACGPGQRQSPAEWERVSLSARDTATLLVDWLNELLGRSEIHARAYREVRRLTLADAGADRATVACQSAHLDAEVRGTPVARWRSPLKAATYHGLQLTRQGDRWKAVVLLDV
jgi:SHS2 domain-containing protein